MGQQEPTGFPQGLTTGKLARARIPCCTATQTTAPSPGPRPGAIAALNPDQREHIHGKLFICAPLCGILSNSGRANGRSGAGVRQLVVHQSRQNASRLSPCAPVRNPQTWCVGTRPPVSRSHAGCCDERQIPSSWMNRPPPSACGRLTRTESDSGLEAGGRPQSSCPATP